jgi:hypothetical protein
MLKIVGFGVRAGLPARIFERIMLKIEQDISK